MKKQKCHVIECAWPMGVDSWCEDPEHREQVLRYPYPSLTVET